jgi:hypothetical protein
MKLEFSRQIFKNYSNFMAVHPVGAQLFHVGGQTEGQRAMSELIVAFRKFANAPKNIRFSVTNIRTN